MLYMVFGGSGSGKSEFAENLSVKLCPGSKVYLATMTDIDDEMEVRIKAHRDMRYGKNFRTVEQGTDIETLQLGGESLVLLECMTNLLANEMYSKEASHKDRTHEHIMEGIRSVYGQVEDMIVITGEAVAEVPLDQEFRRYVKEFGKVNQMLAREADVVIEVKFGLPLVLKGADIYEGN